jgi:hypothetical protein
VRTPGAPESPRSPSTGNFDSTDALVQQAFHGEVEWLVAQYLADP